VNVKLSDGSVFPLPAPRHDDPTGPIWKARNTPALLTTDDLKLLADTSAAYSELIIRSRPARVAAVTRAVKEGMRRHARTLIGLPETG